MRVLHQMPRLDSERDRTAFYDWWGTESAIINATTKYCYYGPFRQRLSVKCAFGGPEHYRADNRSFRVEDDSFLLLGEGCLTESFIGYERPVNSFSVFLAPGAVRKCFQDNRTYIDAAQNLQPGLHGLNQPAGRILRQLWLLSRESQVEHSELESLLDELLINLVEGEVTRVLHQSSLRRQAVCKLHRARDYIESQYPERLSLQDIAQQAAMSPFHLSRAFKRQFGVSPMTYLRHRRVEAADRLIRQQGFKIGDAAARVGFVSRSTFIRQYRNRFGRSPSGRD